METRQGDLDDPALVDDVVVEDDVDGARGAVGLLQSLQEVDEQPADLADTLDIDHATLGQVLRAMLSLHRHSLH